MVNHLTLSEEERLAGPSAVTRVNTNAFFLPHEPLHPFDTRKGKLKNKTKYISGDVGVAEASQHALSLRVCLCVGVCRS